MTNPTPKPAPEIEPGDNPTPELGHGGGVGGPIPMLRAQPLEPPEHILQYFEYEHLPKHLQQVSRPFCELARRIVLGDPKAGPYAAPLPRNPERTVALRKLLEAKDAAVRALLAKEVPHGGR